MEFLPGLWKSSRSGEWQWLHCVNVNTTTGEYSYLSSFYKFTTIKQAKKKGKGLPSCGSSLQGSLTSEWKGCSLRTDHFMQGGSCTTQRPQEVWSPEPPWGAPTLSRVSEKNPLRADPNADSQEWPGQMHMWTADCSPWKEDRGVLHQEGQQVSEKAWCLRNFKLLLCLEKNDMTG